MNLRTKKKNLIKKITTNFFLLSLILVPVIFIYTSDLKATFENSDYNSLERIEHELLIKKNTNAAFNIEPKEILNLNDEWDNFIYNFDANQNGISDKLDLELNAKKNEYDIYSKEKSLYENDNIDFIIQFPKNYDYNLVSAEFENLGGLIKYTYDSALNGFAGSICKDSFKLFSDNLRDASINFLIEEDTPVDAQLYYVSRNMNLRPYTWNNLGSGYDGDKFSSIAILDTGIDESHSFFPNGYADQDPNSKIIGWYDAFGVPSVNPIDENGHGTHVAGIAAGEGSIMLDSLGRTVGTTGFNLDYSLGIDPPLPDGYAVVFTVARFNVTSLGNITIECEFLDSTAGADAMHGFTYLYQDSTEVDSIEILGSSWDQNLTYNVNTNSKLGEYELEFWWLIDDGSGNGVVTYPNSYFLGVIHYPFNPPLFGSGNPWKGVAPDAKIVGVQVLGSSGGGTAASIISGVEWVITNKLNYNITVMTMSLGTSDGSSDAGLITAVNNAVEAGIVTICAAGNRGVGGDEIGSPGDADKVITVAAMNYEDQITSYSSQGGTKTPKNTTKPDITAPGGSTNDITMFSADSNDDDLENAYGSDYYFNDTYSAQGTSMATPAVAGAANLLIEAMGGHPIWLYTEAQALLVKNLLLLTATETVNWREINTAYSPTLDRGPKDIHEGYGRINIDAAIECWINNLTDSILSAKAISIWLNTSRYNPYGKHAYGGFVELEQGIEYTFNLTVPSGADYDLYLYNYTPNEYGEPIIKAVGRSSIKGQDEVFNYTADHTGKYFLVVKAVADPLPTSQEDDDDEKSTTQVIDLLEFLLSPLGLLIIGATVAAVIIVVLLAKRSGKKDQYEWKGY